VRALAAQVLTLKERAAEVERAMAAVQAAAGPARGAEVARMLTLPQVGLTTAAPLVGETGDPTRFGGDANRSVAYSGLAPAVHQSGAGGPSGRPRRRYNRQLKRAFLFLARNQVRADPRARAYYQRKRREGKGHWPARRCLARHLCRIAFRMLSRGLTYQEAASGAAAPSRGAPPGPPTSTTPRGTPGWGASPSTSCWGCASGTTGSCTGGSRRRRTGPERRPGS
jgi:hypothetical protein